HRDVAVLLVPRGSGLLSARVDDDAKLRVLGLAVRLDEPVEGGGVAGVEEHILPVDPVALNGLLALHKFPLAFEFLLGVVTANGKSPRSRPRGQRNDKGECKKPSKGEPPLRLGTGTASIASDESCPAKD